MSLFGKISAKLASRGHKAAEPSSKAEDLRLHSRFSLRDLPCELRVGERRYSIDLDDLSFSGFSFTWATFEPFPILTQQVSAALILVGSELPFAASLVYQKENKLGFSFQQRDTGVLLYIRDLLESCRMGQGMQVLNQALLRKEEGPAVLVLASGEGPSNLVLRRFAPEDQQFQAVSWRIEGLSKEHSVYFDGQRFFSLNVNLGQGLPTQKELATSKEASAEQLRFFACFIANLPPIFKSKALEDLLSKTTRRCLQLAGGTQLS